MFAAMVRLMNAEAAAVADQQRQMRAATRR
jgi:hypothetical protein